MKKAYIFINYPNIVVLKAYLDVIKKSLENNGYECSYVKDLVNIDKRSLIIYPMGNDAFKYFFKGYHNFMLWQQGVTAEESFMRHHSIFRRMILNYFDCFSMKKAKALFYVSSELQEYYERKARCSFRDKSYIMPCYNEIFERDKVQAKDYSRPVFTYVGSLSVWQCFDKTIEIFKYIEDKRKDAFLKVLTFQVDEAVAAIERVGIRNYEVKYVTQECVKEELQSVNYGFIIRNDSIVNRVATPTKISSYLAAGVLPIFSDCLVDFNKVASKYDIALAVSPEMDNAQIADSIIGYIGKTKTDIIDQISEIFDTYYSVDYHIERISTMLRSII